MDKCASFIYVKFLTDHLLIKKKLSMSHKNIISNNDKSKKVKISQFANVQYLTIQKKKEKI